MRNNSGIEPAPLRRISSWEITYTAAGVRESFWAFLATEVISIAANSSMLISAKPRGGGGPASEAQAHRAVKTSSNTDLLMPELTPGNLIGGAAAEDYSMILNLGG